MYMLSEILDRVSIDLPVAVIVREIGKDVNADYIKTVVKGNQNIFKSKCI